MREIKFRAWDEVNKIMHYDFQFLGMNNDVIIFSSDKQTLDLFRKPPINKEQFILMQFTGLKDKNEKDIYEDDIINNLIVTFVSDQEASLGMNAGWYLQRDNFESWTELKSRSNDNKNNYEVTGNIYENVEVI